MSIHYSNNPFDLYQNQSWLIKLLRRRYYLVVPFRALCTWLLSSCSFHSSWLFALGFAEIQMNRTIKLDPRELEEDIPELLRIKIDTAGLQKARYDRGKRLKLPKVKVSERILQEIYRLHYKDIKK